MKPARTAIYSLPYPSTELNSKSRIQGYTPKEITSTTINPKNPNTNPNCLSDLLNPDLSIETRNNEINTLNNPETPITIGTKDPFLRIPD